MAIRRDERDGQRVAEWDTEAGTYTRWDEAGAVLETRPLTDAERAELTSPSADPIAEAQAAIQAATTVAALRAATLKLAAALGEVRL